VLSQQYGIGQFALDSMRQESNYWQLVERNTGVETDEEGKD
jgi:hypothetical protein